MTLRSLPPHLVEAKAEQPVDDDEAFMAISGPSHPALQGDFAEQLVALGLR